MREEESGHMFHHDLCVNVLGDYGGRYLVSCCECMVNMYITEMKRSIKFH